MSRGSLLERTSILTLLHSVHGGEGEADGEASSKKAEDGEPTRVGLPGQSIKPIKPAQSLQPGQQPVLLFGLY